MKAKAEQNEKEIAYASIHSDELVNKLKEIV